MACSAERHHQDLADDLLRQRTAVHRSCCRLQHRVLRRVTAGGPAHESCCRRNVFQPLVLSARAGGVATLTFNRGTRFNPLSSAMITALHAVLDAVAADASPRVVVIAAEGRGFCSGHDMKEMRQHATDHGWQQRLFDGCSRMMLRITEVPQPVIARVHGIATAAGCQLVAMCDLAVAADTAVRPWPATWRSRTRPKGSMPLSRSAPPPGGSGKRRVRSGHRHPYGDLMPMRAAV